MASTCELRLAGAEPPVLQAAAEAAVAEVRRIEQRYSRYRDDSVVSRINAQAGGAAWVDVDDETQALLDFAAQLHRLSDGLFDITSGVLRRAWNFKSGRPPEPEAVAALLPCVGFEQLEREGRRVRLQRVGMEIDFGGFGKEYAADRAAALLMDAGVAHGFVNLGGDIRVLGPREDGSPWVFGIQHPRQLGQVVARVALSHGALATSGDYERYFVHEGRRYCHVLDPRSGWPVQHWQSVSTTQPACTAAGALTTIALLRGEGALAWLQSQHAAYLAVDAQGQVQARDMGWQELEVSD